MWRVGRRGVGITDLGHHVREIRRASTAVGPVAGERHLHAQRLAVLHHQLDLGIGIGHKLVDRDDGRHAVVLAQVVDVTIQVSEASTQCGQVLFTQILAGDATVELKRTNRGHQYRSRGADARRAALDVDELLGAQIGAKPRLGHHVVGEAQARHGGDHAVAAVGDIGEGATVNKRRRAFKGLHQVG